jgi:hypothetical protein
MQERTNRIGHSRRTNKPDGTYLEYKTNQMGHTWYLEVK